MELYFTQRELAWQDTFPVKDKEGNTVFAVDWRITYGHRITVKDASGKEAGLAKERAVSLLRKFDLYQGEERIGTVGKKLSFPVQKYELSVRDWALAGTPGVEYQIVDGSGTEIASVRVEIARMIDTCRMKVGKDEDALLALLVVLAMNGLKSSRASTMQSPVQ
jgi:uncharacterized protein YxjI